ncbi:hypothetical protein BU24DRAFT_463089 [Aaosphaeria arxii CBS 175.79]|uniref:Uncharacterized protein n=1 Tax=Aaosphaeria arxii CBS 175.79 TaxID=1450172 RepID=A0A6A5XND8_9PLEO|nr:uncharacterized protein BU24DRAFT_463089 [Aaosphaeria arxii CBS 175.79]KAF2014291.1 hypothetical protein BU24DRAFT_463089 [Aaosphaeria arxii CBS 175.79]
MILNIVWFFLLFMFHPLLSAGAPLNATEVITCGFLVRQFEQCIDGKENDYIEMTNIFREVDHSVVRYPNPKNPIKIKNKSTVKVHIEGFPGQVATGFSVDGRFGFWYNDQGWPADGEGGLGKCLTYGWDNVPFKCAHTSKPAPRHRDMDCAFPC